MRVLIDTNIFIERENFHVVPEDLRFLLQILNKLNVQILIHPKSIDEIKRNGNEIRRKVCLSKIQTYPRLDSPPDPSNDEEFAQLVGRVENVRDYVDNLLLYAVYKDAVDFLLTEDKKIHEKAFKLGISDRILSVSEALEIFREALPKDKIISPPAIRKEFAYNLNLEDPFFDSLKEEYPDFETWFRKIKREGRECWVYFKDDGTIGALLIPKIENELVDSIPPLPAKRRLKICTFKVSYIGHRIGELFIRISVNYCVQNNIDEMYLTHYTKEKDYLVDLISEYGFFRVASKNSEDVYLKRLVPSQEDFRKDLVVRERDRYPLKFAKKYYPSFYDGPLVKKFIVPILPEYHDRLFIESPSRQTKILEHAGRFIVEGNTIKKAYLCHSRISRLYQGDILLFYRSRDKVLTSLGVLEKSRITQDKDLILRMVGKRTVYTTKEIEEMTKKPTLVMLFQFHFNFKRPLSLPRLINLGILKMAPQTITKISHKKYLIIKKEGQLDERYTFDKA